VHVDDVASAKASLKGQKVSGEEAKKAGEEWAQKAGSKIDSTVGYPSFITFFA
jgi:hypothetical protein